MAEDNQQHEETPQVFAVERDIDGGWKFRRRDLLLGAALAAAGGALAGCGGNKKSTYATFKTPAPTLIPTYGPGDKAAACQNTWAHSGSVSKTACEREYADFSRHGLNHQGLVAARSGLAAQPSQQQPCAH